MQVIFTLTNVRNMVARPEPGNQSEISGSFTLTTILVGGAEVETLSIPGVAIVPDVIEAYPFGLGLVTATSLTLGARVAMRLRFASGSVMPSNGAVSVVLPHQLSLGTGGVNITANASFAGVAESAARTTVLWSSRTVVVNRTGAGAPVYPGQLIVVDIRNVVAPKVAGMTDMYYVSLLTVDGATIAAGSLAGTVFGRPSAPLNVTLNCCPAQWSPSWTGSNDDPRCIVVSFDPPALDGGARVVAYTIDVDAASFAFNEINQNIIVPAPVGGGHTSANTMQEQQGAYLFVRVAAVSNRSDGTGLGSGAYEYAGPIRALSVPGVGRPAAIRAAAADQIFVSWFPPEFSGAVLPSPVVIAYKIEFYGPGNKTTSPADTLIVPGRATSAVSRVLQSGLYTVWVSAANVAGFGEPGEYSTAGIASPLVAPAWDNTVTPLEKNVLSIRVGTLATYIVRAFDGDVTDTVAVLVEEDPGLPPQAFVGAPVVGGINGGVGNMVERIFEMTPDAAQAKQSIIK